MEFMFFLLFVVFVMFALVVYLKMSSKKMVGGDAPWPFDAKTPLSEPEQVLYFRLVQALPQHVILAQVALASLLSVKKNHDARAWIRRISGMSAAFVVCNKDFSIVAVIELDDEAVASKDQIAADANKVQALEATGIHIIRWQVKSMPELALIQSTFNQ